jgi:hypothetical protein
VNVLLDMGRKILATPPFSVLLGAQLTAYETRRAQLSLPLCERKIRHMFSDSSKYCRSAQAG